MSFETVIRLCWRLIFDAGVNPIAGVGILR